MTKDWKDNLINATVSTIIMIGIIVFGEWRRGTLESVLYYFVMAVVFFAIMVAARYFIQIRKK